MRPKNSLAKTIIMYYSIFHRIYDLAFKKYSALLFLSISLIALITNQTTVYANITEETAEEYRLKGYEAQEKGNYDKALEFYTKSLNLVPDNAILYNDMGVLYEQIGVETRAEEYYLRAIRVDPNYLPPYSNLALFYQNNGDEIKAAEYFRERYQRAQPGDPWAEKAKSELFKIDPEERRRILGEQALRLTEELVQNAKEEFSKQVVRSEKHYQRGLELLDRKAFDAALDEFDRALSLTPDNPKILRAYERVSEERIKNTVQKHTDQAMEMLDSGDVDSAKKEYQKILAIIPSESDQKSE